MARDPKTGRFPKGNGAGSGQWGGPAKGEGAPPEALRDPAIRALRFDAEHQALKDEIAAQMRGVLYQVALEGEAEAARINAADKLLDRIEGKPLVKQDLTSKGERLGYVIAAPAEAEDADAWARQHQPR